MHDGNECLVKALILEAASAGANAGERKISPSLKKGEMVERAA
jgi:hypothetical protein